MNLNLGLAYLIIFALNLEKKQKNERQIHREIKY